MPRRRDLAAPPAHADPAPAGEGTGGGEGVGARRSISAIAAAGVFLGSSAIIIASVTAVRRMIAELQIRRAGATEGGIIFSLENGQVWASWNGSGPPLRLGSQERVEEMMEDFLAQGELGRRLTGQTD